ncbi:hypothetical protein RUND412_007718 [Rhizina undulata]
MFPTRLLLQKLYKAKKPWPPDFTLLSPRHQFRLERRYRRRAKLKWARPGLQKFVKLAQAGSTIYPELGFRVEEFVLDHAITTETRLQDLR